MTSSGSLSSKKPRISVKTVYEKQNRNLDLQLKLLETKNVKVKSTNLTNIMKKNKLHIWPRIKRICKNVG